MPNIRKDPAYVGRPAADPFLNDLRNLIDIDPDARGWGAMTDLAIATDMNDELVYSGPPSIEEVILFWRDERHATNDGTDTNNTNVFGRLCLLSKSAIGGDPFDRQDPTKYVDAEELASALLWVDMLRQPEAWQLYNIDLNKGSVSNGLNDLRRAGVFNAALRDQFQALSDNKFNALQHWRLPRSDVTEGDIVAARAL